MPTVNILGHPFSSYWLMFFIGVVGMAIICCARAKRYRLTLFQAVSFSLMLTVSGLVGTKLLYVLENWEETLRDGLTLGGQSFFGALFLVPFAVALFGKVFRLHPLESMDLSAPPVIFILMCMRIGCMMNGCCGGIWCGTFQIPAQFLEATVDAIIFVYLLYIENSERGKNKLYPLLMFFYGIARFFLEFIRDTTKDWAGMSHGQWFSLIAIGVSIVWLLVEKRKVKL